ncbi:signal peptidase II [Anaerostipes sp.]|uniref:signal peptidase II n=1 Tax=Anaerostipes sp. TaxID=1872530 RepID=UPI0025BC488F|nr:signal peptidase II [Anaerostipes sp.]MBS7008176.1 signal peptidase II [Anaerostipes sp.]
MKHIKVFVSIILLLAADQVSKAAAAACLRGKEGISILKDVFELQYVENRGAAFGILQNQQWLFFIITVLAVVLLTIVYLKLPEEKRYFPLRMCYIFLCAGAAGNLIDRAVRGYVVDFFYFKAIDFPVFNVADIYVTVSMAVLFFLILVFYKEDDFAFLEKRKQI